MHNVTRVTFCPVVRVLTGDVGDFLLMSFLFLVCPAFSVRLAAFCSVFRLPQILLVECETVPLQCLGL